MAAEMDWPAAAQQISDFGVPCTAEQLQDVEWVYRQLGQMGYSLRITMITVNSYLQQVAEIGKLSPDHPVVQQTVAQLEAAGGFFTYQLQGNEYETRGSHNTFLCESLPQCAAVALFNMARLGAENADSDTDTEHS